MRFGLGLGYGLGLRNQLASGGGVPFKNTISLSTKGRSGLTLSDSFGNDASIIPACGLINATNYLSKTITNFEASDSSGFVEISFYFDGSANTFRLFSTTNSGSSSTYFDIAVLTDKKPLLTLRSSTAFTNTLASNVALTAGVRTVRWGSTGSAYYLTIDGVTTAFTTYSGLNDGKWLNAGLLGTARNKITIGASEKSSLSTSSTSFNIYSVNYNDEHRWIISGLGNNAYDNIGSSHMAWVGSGHVAYDANTPKHYMDTGYTYASKGGAVSEYIPYTSLGVPVDVSSYLVGYTYSNCAGDMSNFNLSPSLINIPSLNYDRSDVVRFNANARGTTYSASHPTRWSPRELVDPRVYYEWGNVGYKGTIGARVDSDGINFFKLFEIQAWSQDYRGNDQFRITKYNNVDSFVVTSGGQPTVDTDDYLILT